MRVLVIAKSIQGIDGHVLLPGENHVPADIWDELRLHEKTQQLLESGELYLPGIIQENDDTSEVEESALDVVIDLKMEAEYNRKNAVCAIAAIKRADKEMLLAYRELENMRSKPRKGVLRVIRECLQKVGG